MSSTYTDNNNPFHGVRISIPSWKPSHNRTSTGLSQIAFPMRRQRFIDVSSLTLPMPTNLLFLTVELILLECILQTAMFTPPFVSKNCA